MNIDIKKLKPGDEGIVRFLAVNDGDFDIEGRGYPHEPLSDSDAAAFLGDRDVLFWVAFEDNEPVAFLYCVVVPLRTSPGRELLLYETGTRHDRRSRGIGSELISAMKRWMAENDVSTVWVLADNPGAVRFYAKCGFDAPEETAVYMTFDS